MRTEVVNEAKNDAINANIIMEATLQQLNSVETIIRDANDLPPRPTITPTQIP
ncbi:MAG: hypothetical protein AAFN11_21290 [Chloroflexota bacterium]